MATRPRPQFEEPPEKVDSQGSDQPVLRTEDELTLLRQFFALLDEWDRRRFYEQKKNQARDGDFS
jgi:hypothetical protein